MIYGGEKSVYVVDVVDLARLGVLSEMQCIDDLVLMGKMVDGCGKWFRRWREDLRNIDWLAGVWKGDRGCCG